MDITPPTLDDSKMDKGTVPMKEAANEALLSRIAKDRRERIVGVKYVQRRDGLNTKELYEYSNFDLFWTKNLRQPTIFGIHYNHNYEPIFNIWEGEGLGTGGWKYEFKHLPEFVKNYPLKWNFNN